MPRAWWVLPLGVLAACTPPSSPGTRVATTERGVVALAADAAGLCHVEGASNGTLYCAGPDGAERREIADGLDGAQQVVLHGDRVLLATGDGVIMASRVGHPVRLLAQGPAHRLATDGRAVYWVERALGTVRRVGFDGKEAQTLVSLDGWLCGIAIEGDSLYVTSDTRGEVLRLRHDGTLVERTSAQERGVCEVAADDGNVYWTRDGVVRVADDAGARDLATVDGVATSVRTRRGTVWWVVDGTALWVKPAEADARLLHKGSSVQALAVTDPRIYWADVSEIRLEASHF